MTLYILTVRVISSYSVHESTILFQWFILLKTLKHFISSSEKKRNMSSDNRALVENNYHKYAVIMLVKTRAHITKKKLRMAVDKKR